MKFNIPNINQYINLHKEELVDLIRIFLGFIFIVKGIQFFFNMNEFLKLLEFVGLTGAYTVLALSHIIIIIHVLGGIFLMLGLLTKLTAFLQLPILLTAIIFVHLRQDFFSDSSLFTIFAFLLSIVFALHGSSKISLDYYLENYKEHEIKFLHKWDR